MTRGKWISLVVFNVLCVGSALGLIFMGAGKQAHDKPYRIFLDPTYDLAPPLLFITGSLLLFLAVLGSWAIFISSKNNCRPLLMFVTTWIVFFSLQGAGAIAGYTVRSQMPGWLDQNMQASLYKHNQHRNNTGFTHGFWDSLQEKLHCCGVNRYEDWFKTVHLYQGNFGDLSTASMPPLSCRSPVTDVSPSLLRLGIDKSCCWNATDVVTTCKAWKEDRCPVWEIGCKEPILHHLEHDGFSEVLIGFILCAQLVAIIVIWRRVFNLIRDNSLAR